MLGALLAWEGGRGRGHVMTLKMVAEAIGDRFSFDAALCSLDFKDELSAFCDPVQGPWLPFSDEYRRSRGNPRTATWGEFMGDIGFRRPEILRQSIGWWQQVMRECEISLVLADSAPCALLAARGLGIPSVAIGTGYLVPPAAMESFPILLPQHATRIYDEAEILETTNAAVAEFGVPKLDRLPAVYASAGQLVFGLDMLDPYDAWREQPLLPPMVGGDPEPASGGDEVFVYFSTKEGSNAGLMEAVGGLGVPTRLFMPGIEEATAQDFARRGVVVERSPVPIHLIARRTRLMVNGGQHGTLCLGLASGLPQVSVPHDLEKQFNAEAAARRGVLRLVDEAQNADHIRSAILDAYEDAAMQRRSRELAEELRPQFLVSRRKWIRRRIAEVMGNRL